MGMGFNRHLRRFAGKGCMGACRNELQQTADSEFEKGKQTTNTKHQPTRLRFKRIALLRNGGEGSEHASSTLAGMFFFYSFNFKFH
jgi:hypothetical protein